MRSRFSLSSHLKAISCFDLALSAAPIGRPAHHPPSYIRVSTQSERPHRALPPASSTNCVVATAASLPLDLALNLCKYACHIEHESSWDAVRARLVHPSEHSRSFARSRLCCHRDEMNTLQIPWGFGDRDLAAAARHTSAPCNDRASRLNTCGRRHISTRTYPMCYPVWSSAATGSMLLDVGESFVLSKWVCTCAIS